MTRDLSAFERASLRWLTRLRFTAGFAKVLVTVVWIRASGTSVGRLPCAFDLYTQITRSRYNEKRTDPKEFQLCIGWGEGEVRENFENAALF